MTEMKSINFEFLRDTRPELAELGAFAEQYTTPDPTSALIKLRIFVEQIVRSLYHYYNLPLLEQDNLSDLLTNNDFHSFVPRQVLDRFHLLRKLGNKAAHGGKGKEEEAILALEEAFKLSKWLYIFRCNGKQEDIGTFTPPPPGGIAAESKGQLKKEKREALERLSKQEIEIQQLIDQIEAERSRTKEAEKTAEELNAIIESSKKIVDELHFDEQTTRERIIDRFLVNAGWNIQDKDQVGQEVELDGQPTDSGKGYADYVLWNDDGKPLAVIEAKRFSIDPQAGITQAKYYANSLEKQFRQRPFIFATNGYEIQLWNDAGNEPPRKIHGFYSKDSLQYLLFQRENKKSHESIKINSNITNRRYQHEAIRRVCERFSSKYRRALVVQATGTGKTRVAISFCDVMFRAKAAKRILFLCDRIELRKQANNVFKEFLGGEPRTTVNSRTYKDRDKRIYLATYPSMMKCFESFDVGFFDLIIADESHRSIYNRYRTLLEYFDANLLGLTATPVDKIHRNTFSLFGCEAQNPTAYYSYEEAVNNNWLVPFRVFQHTTAFLREGIKFENLTEKQKDQLIEQDENPEFFNFNQSEIDKYIFNKDTNRHIIRNLMENGIREESGTHPGKSIIFARNHNHAVILHEVFNEMFPQYGGKFCKIIDTYDSRAEALIDEFKDPNNDLHIAISVDMLDTGIDIPEVVNLVFAKPVWSPVKFWQMIGRGTRLCENLFGPGNHKKEFYIFDHWGNFDRFDEQYDQAEASLKKSLMQQVFESRITLAETALHKADVPSFHAAIDLIQKDINALPNENIHVREHWKQVCLAANPEALKQFDAKTVSVLKEEIAPLMQWRQEVSKRSAEYKFDMLIANMQTELLNESAAFEDLKSDLLNRVEQLRMNLSQVQAKATTIQTIRKNDYWKTVTVQSLEELRNELRGIMQFKLNEKPPAYTPPVTDIEEDESKIEYREFEPQSLETLNMVKYKNEVESALKEIIDTNPTLIKIKAGQPVNQKDLDELNSLILTQHSNVNLKVLEEFWPDTKGHLDYAIRRIIGMDSEAVQKEFQDFINQHNLSSKQLKFLDMLKNHIRNYGSIELEELYEQPFTALDSNGLDGIFTNDEQINYIVDILDRFKPKEGTRPQA